MLGHERRNLPCRWMNSCEHCPTSSWRPRMTRQPRRTTTAMATDAAATRWGAPSGAMTPADGASTAELGLATALLRRERAVRGQAHERCGGRH
jgi:hypothetical protein